MDDGCRLAGSLLSLAGQSHAGDQHRRDLPDVVPRDGASSRRFLAEHRILDAVEDEACAEAEVEYQADRAVEDVTGHGLAGHRERLVHRRRDVSGKLQGVASFNFPICKILFSDYV